MDRYNLVLGVIFVDGINVNLELVRAELAEVYDGRPPRGFDIGPYLDAEKEARDTKTGSESRGTNMSAPGSGGGETRNKQRGGE